MKDVDRCPNEECAEGFFPYYGLAPHTHDLSGGSFIGSTRIAPKETWPKNFIEDPEAETCGTYVCPDCGYGR